MQQIREDISKRDQERVKKILDANIDFTALGWVSRVAKVINIPYQKVGQFMKKHLPEIYEKAKKRKSKKEP